MKKTLLLAASVAVFAWTGVAQAAELKNLDKEPVKVMVKSKGKSGTITLKPGETYTLKEGKAMLVVGKKRVRATGGKEAFAVQSGKIIAQNDEGKAVLKKMAENRAKRQAKRQAIKAKKTAGSAPATGKAAQ